MKLREFEWLSLMVWNLADNDSYVSFPITEEIITRQFTSVEKDIKSDLSFFDMLKYGTEITAIRQKSIDICCRNIKKFDSNKRAWKLLLMNLLVIGFRELELRSKNFYDQEELLRNYNLVFMNIAAGVYPPESDKENLSKEYEILLQELYEIYANKKNI
jgi:hypothetical protein